MSKYKPRVTEAQKAKHREDERRRRIEKGDHVRALDRALQPKRKEERRANPEPSRARWRAYRSRNLLAFKERDAVSAFRKRYGIGRKEYDAMHAAQGGLCAICRRTCRSGRALAVDHCHETGRVRGLLCASCNGGLGLFGDRTDLLSSAIRYLEET